MLLIPPHFANAAHALEKVKLKQTLTNISRGKTKTQGDFNIASAGGGESKASNGHCTVTAGHGAASTDCKQGHGASAGLGIDPEAFERLQ